MRLLILFLLAPFFLFAQQKYALTGFVVEKGSTAIPGASVFIEGTTMGTQADANGLYTLKNIPAGRHRLVASLVGYVPKMVFIEVPGKITVYNFTLEEDNKTLGYKITYFMYNFERTNSLTSFKGLASFQELVPEDARQERRWNRNRVEAYEGSIKHFLKSLVDNRLEEEGFNAFLLKPEYLNNLRRGLFFDRNNERHISFKAVDLIGTISEEGLITMDWKTPMEVVFNRKRVSRPIFMDAPYPYTILIPKGPIQLTRNGDYPFAIEMRGEMSKIGMADLLPLDFEINTEK